MLKIGDAAPDFTLTSHQGGEVALKSYQSQKWVILYFYPKDFTPVCTRQSCFFRDARAQLGTTPVEILGISSDSVSTHQSFAQTHQLPFPLLSDADKSVRKKYEANWLLGLLPLRVTYVIDPQGTIRYVHSSRFNAQSHVQKSLEYIQFHLQTTSKTR